MDTKKGGRWGGGDNLLRQGRKERRDKTNQIIKIGRRAYKKDEIDKECNPFCRPEFR